MNKLSEKIKLKNLKTKFLAQNITYYESIDSTQLEVWRRVKNKDIKNGDLVLAQIQTNGKGTHGRIWHTDEKNNIAFSFYIKADCNIEKLDKFTIEIAETIIEAFKKIYKINLQIKKPNDIVYSGKKIGGILTETKLKGNEVKHIVVGIGINTNQENFNDQIKDIATSIKKEFKIEIDNLKIISEFCNLIEEKIIRRIGV